VSSTLDRYVADRLTERDGIPRARRQALIRLADVIAQALAERGVARLVFVCTHNSRRSHFAQVWAVACARRFAVHGIEAFSAGTESTAVHPRVLDTLEEAGFRVDRGCAGANPRHDVWIDESIGAVRLWSKTLADPAIPGEGFIAVMTCSDADAACPHVRGAAARVSLAYEDPKRFDGTAGEAAGYAQRCRQIGREMALVFSRLASRRGLEPRSS